MANERTQTATQKYARLFGLRDSVGEGHYERVALADELLKDAAWVEDPAGGGGNESKAIDRLEAECLADLCGLGFPLPRLLDVYHHIPDIAEWRKYKFNVFKMWSDWSARQKAARRKATPADKAKARATREYTPPNRFAELTDAQARKEYERTYHAVESDAAKIARLQEENDRLKAENLALKEENRRLKKAAHDMFRMTGA